MAESRTGACSVGRPFYRRGGQLPPHVRPRETHSDSLRPSLVLQLKHRAVDWLDLDFLLFLLDEVTCRVVRERTKVEAAREARRDGADAACGTKLY